MKRSSSLILLLPLIANCFAIGSRDAFGRPVKTLRKGSPGYTLASHSSNPRRNHGQGQILFPGQQVPHCPQDIQCTPQDRRYRTNDGSCNNLRHPRFGQAGLPFIRFLPRQESLLSCGPNLPNPRKVSSLTIKRGEMGHTSDLSIMVMSWGQIMDHDIELTPPREISEGEFLDCCEDENLNSPDCCVLMAPAADRFYGLEGRPRCIAFLRSKLVQPGGCTGPRTPDVANDNSAWVDGSFVYGSDDVKVEFLRAKKEGLLETSVDRRNRTFPKISFDEKIKMEFGDPRGDVHPGAVVLTTVFLRNHNRIAKGLLKIHPNWNDEQLFQETRKINAAIIQKITFTEFINSLLGNPNNVGLPALGGQHIDFYDETVNGAISMGFGTAGYRLHTYVSGFIDLRNKNFVKTRSLQLRNVFHDAVLTMSNDTYNEVMRGHCGQPLQDFDNIFTTEMTEWLFKEKEKNFGMDIAALNIQRGRDHQIPGYPTYREFCGLGKVNSWADLTDLIPGDLVHRLVHLYDKPDDVDLYVAGNMERAVAGSILGPTFHCLVRDQFERLRNGDRFFFTNPGQFTNRQLKSISEQTLAGMMCLNSDNVNEMSLPKNVFKIAHNLRNPLFPCSDLHAHPRLDLNAWR